MYSCANVNGLIIHKQLLEGMEAFSKSNKFEVGRTNSTINFEI